MNKENIKKLRQKLQLTRKQFAKLLGKHFTTIHRWENGSLGVSGESKMKLWLLAEKNNIDLPKTVLESVAIFTNKSLKYIEENKDFFVSCNEECKDFNLNIGDIVKINLPKVYK